MERKRLEKEELLERREELLEKYYAPTAKNCKPFILTKRERKILGIGRDQGKAVLKYARISPRKVKIVLDLIKGKSLDEAYAIVRYTPKAASELIYKLLKSAEANAVNNFELDADKLYVADAYASQGPILKRMQPVSRGRGNRINKRTSHITVVVKERV
ncbi:MAG: 50S ribosomal protein L22 [Ruminococcaceae bacterium]|nr:50S ribosomal protein L22 [Oscillospiraceae bacterium]